jgi:ribonuclease-3
MTEDESKPKKPIFKLKTNGAGMKDGASTALRYSRQAVDSPPSELNLEVFEGLIGYRFADEKLLCTALTHRSLQAIGERSHYERLEFLGDAVLDLAIAELLLEEYPTANEGTLSKLRAALVNTTCLASVATELEFGKYVRLSRGEIAAGGAERPALLADVVEAVVGAAFYESGYERTKEMVRKVFSKRINDVAPSDPKTELQERVHMLSRKAPQYKVECTEGPEHSPVFVSVVLIDGEIFGRGRGSTKKLSQQAAAAEALRALADVQK